ncbi:MAG: hypothetical protein ACUVSQ_07005 [Pseudanabaenaceae cyanobacterium]
MPRPAALALTTRNSLRKDPPTRDVPWAVADLEPLAQVPRPPLPVANGLAAYPAAIHLKQLPIVATLRWLTPVLVTAIAFPIWGVEEIGLQIEDPFGRDANDLPYPG